MKEMGVIVLLLLHSFFYVAFCFNDGKSLVLYLFRRNLAFSYLVYILAKPTKETRSEFQQYSSI